MSVQWMSVGGKNYKEKYISENCENKKNYLKYRSQKCEFSQIKYVSFFSMTQKFSVSLVGQLSKSRQPNNHLIVQMLNKV